MIDDARNKDDDDDNDYGIMDGPIKVKLDDSILESVVSVEMQNMNEIELIAELLQNQQVPVLDMNDGMLVVDQVQAGHVLNQPQNIPILDPLDGNPLAWPQFNDLPYDEYNTPYLFTNAFPCLFTFGNEHN